MSTKADLQVKMEELQRQLEAAELEIDRQKRDAAAASRVPPQEEAFLAAIAKVNLPSFWEDDPVLWFQQCESAFRRANVTSPGAKYDQVVGKLPNAVSLSCRSLLLSIKFEDPDCYEKLKTHLVLSLIHI